MNAIVTVSARLPAPPDLGERGIDGRLWRVLCETTFPNARSAEAVAMAFDYCKARGLDPLKRPVHIVPMWNSTLRKEVETVWPGINEVQITAARTGAWAGMDEPRWGPTIKRRFEGFRRDGGNRVSASIEVEFPEWCSVTVYRLVNGHRCAFTEPVFWLEAYSRAGGADNELPTPMWVKRPRGQLHRVAKAAALRAAFPEEGEYTAEEMEGKEIEAGGIVIDHALPPPPPRVSPIPDTPDAFLKALDENLAAAQSRAAAAAVWAAAQATVKAFDEEHRAAADSLLAKHRARFPASAAPPPPPGPSTPEAREIVESHPQRPIETVDPERFLADADAQMAAAQDIDTLNEVWSTQIEPKLDDLFPPDREEAMGLFRKHERRVSP